MFQYFLILAMVEIWIWLDLIKANFFGLRLCWPCSLYRDTGQWPSEKAWEAWRWMASGICRCVVRASQQAKLIFSKVPIAHPGWWRSLFHTYNETRFDMDPKNRKDSASHWRRQQWSRQPFDLVKHNPPISGLWSNYQQHLRDAFSFPSFCLGQVSRYVPMFCV